MDYLHGQIVGQDLKNYEMFDRFMVGHKLMREDIYFESNILSILAPDHFPFLLEIKISYK